MVRRSKNGRYPAAPRFFFLRAHFFSAPAGSPARTARSSPPAYLRPPVRNRSGRSPRPSTNFPRRAYRHHRPQAHTPAHPDPHQGPVSRTTRHWPRARSHRCRPRARTRPPSTPRTHTTGRHALTRPPKSTLADSAPIFRGAARGPTPLRVVAHRKMRTPCSAVRLNPEWPRAHRDALNVTHPLPPKFTRWLAEPAPSGGVTSNKAHR